MHEVAPSKPLRTLPATTILQNIGKREPPSEIECVILVQERECTHSSSTGFALSFAAQFCNLTLGCLVRGVASSHLPFKADCNHRLGSFDKASISLGKKLLQLEDKTNRMSCVLLEQEWHPIFFFLAEFYGTARRLLLCT